MANKLDRAIQKVGHLDFSQNKHTYTEKTIWEEEANM